MHVRSDDSNLRPCASVPAVVGREFDDLRLYLSGAVAERRLEEKLRSRTFSVTILSCVYTEISGDNHGCFYQLSL